MHGVRSPDAWLPTTGLSIITEAVTSSLITDAYIYRRSLNMQKQHCLVKYWIKLRCKVTEV